MATVKVRISNGKFVMVPITSDGERYSTSEQRIGTWIDGKPLYRKVIDFGYLPNNDTKTLVHGITNIGITVSLKGICAPSGKNPVLPIPFADTSTNTAIRLWSNTTNVFIYCQSDYSNRYAYIILEYTKTTD